jgi:hypothetical protein
MSWAHFIATGIGGWAKKGAAALGVGVITYAGWSAIKGQVATAITNALGAMGGDVYQLLALAGFVDAIGIWLGALTTAVSLLAIKRLGVLSA